MDSKGIKIIAAVAGLVVACYVGDAVYPTWDVNCEGTRKADPRIANDGRVVLPYQPKGCTLTPHNALRSAYNYFFPLPSKPSK